MNTSRGFVAGLALGLVFALGFATATWLAPRATAQSSERWQYMVVNHGFDGGRWANDQGRVGWRFIGFDAHSDHVLIFERRAP